MSILRKHFSARRYLAAAMPLGPAPITAIFFTLKRPDGRNNETMEICEGEFEKVFMRCEASSCEVLYLSASEG